MSGFICPLCKLPFAADPAVVEIEIRIKSEWGGERTRNVYCVPCSKVILEKGVYHWDEVLEEAIRKEIGHSAATKESES